MPPVTATIYARGTSGAPSTTVLPLPLIPDSIAFTATWQGGDESAEISGAVSVRDAQAWLDVLQCGVVIADAHARPVWRGYIETVEVDDGATRAATTIEGLVNSVRVSYTPRTGAAAITSAASDSNSTARYGTHAAVLSLSQATAAEAEARRDAYLARSAWPRYETGGSLRRGGGRAGMGTVTLRCRGWFAAMYWALTNRPVNGTEVNTTTDQALIGLHSLGGFGGTYGIQEAPSFTGPTIPVQLDVSTHYPTTERDEHKAVGQFVEEIIARGDASDRPLSYQARGDLSSSPDAGDGHLPVLRTKVWAGASPTTFGYTLAGGTVLGAAGLPAPWARVRPDAMVRRTAASPLFAPTSAVDTPGRFYLARTSYQWARGQGETLTLEPLGGGSAAALLARVR